MSQDPPPSIWARLTGHPQFGGAVISGLALLISIACAVVLLAQ